MKLKVLFLFTLVFCASQISFAQETRVNVSNVRGYLIGPGDVVSIKVFNEKEFDVDRWLDAFCNKRVKRREDRKHAGLVV